MLYYKLKFVEVFKDGNVMDGRLFKQNEVVIVSENDKNRIIQSGAVVDILETLIKNPLKDLPKEPVVEPVVEPVSTEEVAPKRRGRPRKNG